MLQKAAMNGLSAKVYALELYPLYTIILHFQLINVRRMFPNNTRIVYKQ